MPGTLGDFGTADGGDGTLGSFGSGGDGTLGSFGLGGAAPAPARPVQWLALRYREPPSLVYREPS